jgi:hypothetical protein
MATSSSSGHHALVIGASGLIGWSVVNQLLQPNPAPSPFDKVTALVNRPLDFGDSLWPRSRPDIPELALVSGVNLMCKDDEFGNLLKEKVHDVASISHVFYFGMSTTARSPMVNIILTRHHSVQRRQGFRERSRHQCWYDATRYSRSQGTFEPFPVLRLSRRHQGMMSSITISWSLLTSSRATASIVRAASLPPLSPKS